MLQLHRNYTRSTWEIEVSEQIQYPKDFKCNKFRNDYYQKPSCKIREAKICTVILWFCM